MVGEKRWALTVLCPSESSFSWDLDTWDQAFMWTGGRGFQSQGLSSELSALKSPQISPGPGSLTWENSPHHVRAGMGVTKRTHLRVQPERGGQDRHFLQPLSFQGFLNPTAHPATLGGAPGCVFQAQGAACFVSSLARS